jgi:hypothetical protein
MNDEEIDKLYLEIVEQIKNARIAVAEVDANIRRIQLEFFNKLKNPETDSRWQALKTSREKIED